MMVSLCDVSTDKVFARKAAVGNADEHIRNTVEIVDGTQEDFMLFSLSCTERDLEMLPAYKGRYLTGYLRENDDQFHRAYFYAKELLPDDPKIDEIFSRDLLSPLSGEMSMVETSREHPEDDSRDLWSLLLDVVSLSYIEAAKDCGKSWDPTITVDPNGKISISSYVLEDLTFTYVEDLREYVKKMRREVLDYDFPLSRREHGLDKITLFNVSMLTGIGVDVTFSPYGVEMDLPEGWLYPLIADGRMPDYLSIPDEHTFTDVLMLTW